METQQLISLYDYLGCPAGPELGRQVADVAIKLKRQVSSRNITNTRYKGIVHLYDRKFLKEYFEAKQLGLEPATALEYLQNNR